MTCIECSFFIIEFAIIFKQRLANHKDRDITIFSDDDIFRIAIHSKIRDIFFSQHPDNLFETMAIRIGF